MSHICYVVKHSSTYPWFEQLLDIPSFWSPDKALLPVSYCCRKGDPFQGRVWPLVECSEMNCLRKHTCWQSKTLYWEGAPRQWGEGTQENCSAAWLAASGCMVMGLVSWWSLASHLVWPIFSLTQGPSWWHSHLSAKMDSHKKDARRLVEHIMGWCLLPSWAPPRFSQLVFDSRSVFLTREGNGNPLWYSCLENPMDGGAWWAAVLSVTKSRTQLSNFTFTFHFHALEKEMATHSSALAWRIPGTAEPGGLPSMGSHRVRHNWSDLAAATAAVFLIGDLLLQDNSSKCVAKVGDFTQWFTSDM